MRPRRHRALGPCLAALLALACGAEEPVAPAASAPEAGTAAPSPPPETAAESPPQAAARPYACIAGDPEAGAAQYAALCASCHGARGAGDGPAGASLQPRPARHDDGAYMNARSNDHLYAVIAEGGAAVGLSPMMAPWKGALGEQGVLDVMAFVRSLATPAYACP